MQERTRTICVGRVGPAPALERQSQPATRDQQARRSLFAYDPDSRSARCFTQSRYLPGHAKSMPVNWKPFRKMRDYAEWVWHFIETVCPGEKPVVCGSGIGGDMTLQIACHHPQGIRAGMAFESAARTGSISFLSGYSDPHTFPSFSALADNASTAAMYYPCDPRKVIESKWQHRATYQETCVADMDAWNDHDVREHLHKIECPIFLFKGEADYHVTEQAVMDTIAAISDGLAEG